MKESVSDENLVYSYYRLLGGHHVDFPKATVKRVVSFGKELLKKRCYQKFTTFKSDTDEMVIINGIKVFSFCEHHLLPFFGYCSIGYIPNGSILGLSKFQRLVDLLASRPATQEHLTTDISTYLERQFKQDEEPLGIGVAMTCIHTCMFGRGINTSTITVNTQVLKGKIYEGVPRQEFLSRIKHEDILR